MAVSRKVQREEDPSEPIRVMVVDGHARVRQGLRFFLSACANIEIVAEAGDGVEALKQFAETHPDVVVIDLAPLGMDCPAVTLRMKQLNPGSQIISLADEADPDNEDRALAAGAFCCVLKDASASALMGAICEAHAYAEAHYMTFVQAKIGASTEWRSNAPSDSNCSVIATG
jgi:DNA-binding NarL/FixJ family response regulator